MKKSLYSTSISLHRVLSVVQPSDVVNRVLPNHDKVVTFIAGSIKQQRLFIMGDGRRSTTHQWILFKTERLEVTLKTTVQNLVVRIAK